MRVTIKEIARELGLSHSTVSRVLNQRENAMVSDTTRDRILSAARTMGYRPNRIAQALKGARSGLIGVFMPESQEHFFSEVLFYLRRCVELAGFELIPFSCSPLNVEERWLKLLRWDLEGVLVFDYLLFADGLGQALLQHHGFVPPIVGLFNAESHLTEFVAFDFAPAMQDLLTHMTDQGARTIAYAAVPGSFHVAEHRYRCYQHFMVDHELEQHRIDVVGGTTLSESALLSAHELISRRSKLPDGIFCQNDEIALGVYRALRQHGVDIPGDIILAGCDNAPFVAYLDTPLTTIVLPIADACQAACQVLQRRIEQPDSEPTRRLMRTSLVIRASTSRNSRQPVQASS